MHVAGHSAYKKLIPTLLRLFIDNVQNPIKRILAAGISYSRLRVFSYFSVTSAPIEIC